MGDPKKPRRSYDTPAHPWQGERIKAEHELVRTYGLKNKREFWKAQTILRNLRGQSRELQARLRAGEHQASIESEKLLSKCARMGLLAMDGSTLDDVLALNEEKILDRRLQTLVVAKNLANTHKQARQMIVHGHIFMGDRRVTVPSYIVKRGEESSIEYNPSSPFTDDLHPMRNPGNNGRSAPVPEPIEEVVAEPEAVAEQKEE